MRQLAKRTRDSLPHVFSTRFFSDEETRRFRLILSQPCDMEYMSSARAPQLSRAQVKKTRATRKENFMFARRPVRCGWRIRHAREAGARLMNLCNHEW
ncbi:MAG: hypothetical protein WAU56_12840 [Steroidobacteraceae bacterium]